MDETEKDREPREASVMNVADRDKIAFARVQRAEPTPGEARLWRSLRGQTLGVKFRRQHPIGDFVLDFYCAEARLAVEVDGAIHEDRTEYDCWRDSQVETQDIHTLRFTEAQVLEKLPRVLDAIRKALTERLARLTPGPSPWPERGVTAGSHEASSQMHLSPRHPKDRGTASPQ